MSEEIKLKLAFRGFTCSFGQWMQGARTFLSARTSQGRGTWSILFLTLFLFLQVLASAPFLHQHWHQDAKQADHHCAVTLLEDGKFECSTSTVSVVLPSATISDVELPVISFVSLVEYRLLPGRAPPALLS